MYNYFMVIRHRPIKINVKSFPVAVLLKRRQQGGQFLKCSERSSEDILK